MHSEFISNLILFIMEAEQLISTASTSSCLKQESPSGSKTPETPSRCRSPGSPIGDDACPICLGAFTDKCAAGSCLHNFCLVCLKEWSKQRPVCPLCKQSFTKILYDIKSETDYKEWVVPVIYPPDLNDIGNRGFIEERVYRSLSVFLDTAHRRFFSYGSTAMGGPRRRQANSSRHLFNTNALPNLPARRREHQPLLDHERGSSLFRLSIYTNNVWIQPMSDITGRYRECNPNLYREQPALTHRLVPWINRELAALLPPSRIGVVLSDVMDLIERYRINSREFRRTLRPHLGAHTRHFVHEFYNFARSPYDMIGHDAAAQYIPRYYADADGDSDDTDDDEVIEIESDGVVVESEPLDLSSRVAREETIGNDGSVFISSDSESSSSIRNFVTRNIDAITQNPEPPRYLASSMLPPVLQRSSDEGNRSAQNLDEPGPSGISSNGSLSVKREHSYLGNSSESDGDCLIVDILKPKRERTPELIHISSNSDDDASDKTTHWKKKMSKEIENKHSKGRKKPRLDRTSFSLRFSGTVNCQRGEDHTYCTDGSPANAANRTDSDEELSRTKKRLDAFRALERRRWNVLESDSDSDSDWELETRRRKTNIRKRPQISSRSKSPNDAPRKVRKDQKSKVKSTSHVTRSMAKASTSKDVKSTSSNYKARNLRKINYEKRFRYRSRSSSSSSSDSSTSSTSSSSSSSSSSDSSSSSSSSSSKSTLCGSNISSICYTTSSSDNLPDSDYSFHLPSENMSRKLKKKRIQSLKRELDRKGKENKSKSGKSSSITKVKKSKEGKSSKKSSKREKERKHK